MVFEQTHYRDFLKNVLTERVRQNPRYSLRAMARQLGVQPSLLSEILRGGRKLTEETALKIADALGLQGDEREYFRLLVQLDRAKSPVLREAIATNLRKIHPRHERVRDLGVAHFRLVSDWYHFALLRLSEIENFAWSNAAAARALGISVFEVEEALRRMRELELIEIDAKGRPRKLTQDLLVGSKTPNEALRKYHDQMLVKTAQALREQPPTRRFSGTETIVLDEAQLEQAHAILNDSLDRIQALSRQKRQASADVYHVGAHLFQLTKPRAEIRKGRKP